MNCKRCNGSGYDPEPALAGYEGACCVCFGHGEEPCLDCGGSGVDFNALGESRTCHCKLPRLIEKEETS